MHCFKTGMVVPMNLQNLRLIRQANGLSLSEMAALLSDNGYPITKATLSNYETGKFIPEQSFYSAVAAELHVGEDFFREDVEYSTDIVFLSDLNLSDRRMQELEAFVAIEVGRSYAVDSLLGISRSWKFTEPVLIKDCDRDSIEDFIEDLRISLELGQQPISSVCGFLERNGWYLFSVPKVFTDHNLSGYIRDISVPFILFEPEVFQDELRISLLRSYGRSMIKGESEESTEYLVDRFARAMLAPGKLLRYEYGEKRTNITEAELSLGKQSFGLGKRYIMARLHELGIVSSSAYTEYLNYLAQRRYLVGIGGIMDNSTFFDVPTSFEMRLARAKAEGIKVPFL